MNNHDGDYGLWALVVVNSLFFILFQWPTLLTLILFPVLLTTYVRLAWREETQALATFGEAYRDYMRRTPGWWPAFKAH